MEYKEGLKQIRQIITAMVDAPESDISHAEYATLAVEAQELSSWLDSVADSLVVASSPECTAALAKMCDAFLKTPPRNRI